MEKILTASAFSPSHITGFFRIFPNGSTGAGLNTDQGVKSRVRLITDGKGTLKIFINGAFNENAKVSVRVVNGYADYIRDSSLEIQHSILSPIGYGLGMSGAGALSLSIALNNVLGQPLDVLKCMEIARISEIQSGTGLGDVVAQQFSGVMMGMPPYPSESVKEIPHSGEKVICGFFAPIETGKIIRDESWKEKINSIGAECMEELSRNFTLEEFVRLSRYFTFETGLASEELNKVLTAMPNSSMAMLGQTVFILSKDVESVVKQLSEFTNRISISDISSSGACLLS